MTEGAKKLLEEALALPDEERRWLVEKLAEADPQVDALARDAWNEVAVERLERAERGEAELVSYDEVRARAEGVVRGQ